MQLVEFHPHPGQAEGMLMKPKEYLLLLLLQADPMRLLGEQDGWVLVALLEDELKRSGQALVERSEVGPGDFKSA